MSSHSKDRAERRLAAVLAADVAGYSRLIGQDEEGTLRRLRAIRAEIVDPAIAANIGGDPGQEYFADGMVEEITTALSKIRWFFVIARNSSFTYKGHAVDVKQAGRELGVRYVLEGSVRRGGDRLRITAQFVEAETGNHVWAERYDRGLADIFAVQDEITERVAAAIEPELYAAENIRSQRKPPESLDAWECVIRAMSQMGLGTREGTREAEALCRLTTVPEIEAEVQTARALDDRDPWAHFAEGNTLDRLCRFEEAVRAQRRALELNPNFAPVHAFLAVASALGGRRAEAIEAAEHALRLSPRDRAVGAFASLAIAFVHCMSGGYTESADWGRRVIDNNPGWVPGWTILTAALGMLGNDLAVAAARDALLRSSPQFSLSWMADNMPPTGELAERLHEGLRKAGIPEA